MCEAELPLTIILPKIPLTAVTVLPTATELFTVSELAVTTFPPISNADVAAKFPKLL